VLKGRHKRGEDKDQLCGLVAEALLYGLTYSLSTLMTRPCYRSSEGEVDFDSELEVPDELKGDFGKAGPFGDALGGVIRHYIGISSVANVHLEVTFLNASSSSSFNLQYSLLLLLTSLAILCPDSCLRNLICGRLVMFAPSQNPHTQTAHLHRTYQTHHTTSKKNVNKENSHGALPSKTPSRQVLGGKNALPTGLRTGLGVKTMSKDGNVIHDSGGQGKGKGKEGDDIG
jgi:hypothetical protein